MLELCQFFSDGATVGHNGKLGTVKEVCIGVYSPKVKGSLDPLTYSEKMPGLSNNEAEFLALLKAMDLAKEHNEKRVVFFCDSQIVINRANGKRPPKKQKNERMDNFQKLVLKKKEWFDICGFIWIPREYNQVADQLSKLNI